MKAQITLGSLFDGIGGFPLSAAFYGIETLWASEILPAAISITKKHFPTMRHKGDIALLNGGELEPVDIITFGSPCQSFSIASGENRTGLAGKSGLFYEAVRIIREMRCATNGKYPQLALFENVPGLLTANGARDYRAVLEAFCETEIPMPQSGKWTSAGMVSGERVDLAWCVYDAQYFGVPQRRRRLFLVADFTGKRAAEILFVPKSLQGYFEACGRQGESFAADAESGAACPRGTNCLTPWDTQQQRVYTPAGVSPTLTGADGGGGRNPAGLVFYPHFTESLTAHSHSSPEMTRVQNFVAYCLQGNMIGRKDKNGPNGGGVNEELAFTLSAADRHCVAAIDCRNLNVFEELSGTLQAKGSGGYSLNYQNPIHVGDVVRRLTPMECERLQGYPDGWTEFGHDGKPISDTARYQTLGNSVAVPCVVYIMQGIAEHLAK